MIDTEHFVIDKLRPEDAADLSDFMVSDKKRFGRFFPVTLAQNHSKEASKAYILLKNIEIGYKSEFTYALREKEGNKVVGLLILKDIDWEIKQGEIAYCIRRDYGGRGWTTKAVSKFSEFAFKKLDLKKLQIIVHLSNKSSLRVAQKCGYLWKRTLPAAFSPVDENVLDMELYELSA